MYHPFTVTGMTIRVHLIYVVYHYSRAKRASAKVGKYYYAVISGIQVTTYIKGAHLFSFLTQRSVERVPQAFVLLHEIGLCLAGLLIYSHKLMAGRRLSLIRNDQLQRAADTT